MKTYKINQFTSEEFNTIDNEYQWPEDEILIVEKPDAYCLDITANGVRLVPILRKIEAALTAAGLAGNDGVYAGWFGQWADDLTDPSSRKYFCYQYSGAEDRRRGCWSYSWGIEQISEDRWYIFLNIAKPQAEQPAEEIEFADEIKVGIQFATERPTYSRFDVANMLHGYNPALTFDQLTAITREIGCTLNKFPW